MATATSPATYSGSAQETKNSQNKIQRKKEKMGVLSLKRLEKPPFDVEVFLIIKEDGFRHLRTSVWNT